LADISKAKGSSRDIITEFRKGIDFSIKVIERKLNEFSGEVMIVRSPESFKSYNYIERTERKMNKLEEGGECIENYKNMLNSEIIPVHNV